MVADSRHWKKALACFAMAKRCPACAPRSMRGGALVEAAIVMPMLLFLFFSFMQYGMILYREVWLHHAAAVAARQAAIVSKGSETTFENLLLNTAESASNQMFGSGLTVQSPSSCSNATARCAQFIYDMPLFLAFVVPGSQNGVLVVNADMVVPWETVGT